MLLAALPSRASTSDLAGRLPGICEDHDLGAPKDDALEEMARSMRQDGTR